MNKTPQDSTRYEIVKLTDILDLPADNIDDFFKDLKQWYETYHRFNDLTKELGDIAGIPSSLTAKGMIWIDDGKHDVKVIIKTPEVES